MIVIMFKAAFDEHGRVGSPAPPGDVGREARVGLLPPTGWARRFAAMSNAMAEFEVVVNPAAEHRLEEERSQRLIASEAASGRLAEDDDQSDIEVPPIEGPAGSAPASDRAHAEDRIRFCRSQCPMRFRLLPLDIASFWYDNRAGQGGS